MAKSHRYRSVISQPAFSNQSTTLPHHSETFLEKDSGLYRPMLLATSLICSWSCFTSLAPVTVSEFFKAGLRPLGGPLLGRGDFFSARAWGAAGCPWREPTACAWR